MTIRQSEVLQGAAHFAKVAGRAAPKLKGKDVRDAIRSEVETEVMDGAVMVDLRASITAQRDRFAECVRHRDQVQLLKRGSKT